MKKFLMALFCLIAAVYPVLLFKVDTKVFSLCIMGLAAAFFLRAMGK